MTKKIAIIGTGGTIAGQGASDTDLTGYTAGVLPLEEIISSVPGVRDYGPFCSAINFVILKVQI